MRAFRQEQGRFWAAIGLSLCGVAPGVASADGNVTATVDSAGDLWLFGDDLDNRIRLEAGGDDTDVFHLVGLDGSTTINGQAELTVFAPGTRMVLFLGEGDNEAWLGSDYGSEPSCCQRELTLFSGPGDDHIQMVGPFPRVTLDLGPGADSVEVAEGASGIAGTLLMGSGDDVISISAFTGASGTFDLGPGKDQFLVGRSSAVLGLVDLGTEDDQLLIEGSNGTLEVRAGGGNDRLELVLDHGLLALDAGAGADEVRIQGGPDAGPLELEIELGNQNDRLFLGGAVLTRVLLDGGLGRDQFLDLGGNDYGPGTPELVSFEVPRAMRESGLAAETSVTGRVVDEHGRPVPGAYVELPGRDLATFTDLAGGFVLGPLVEERGDELELVASATLDGRPRSGAARAELVPLGTTPVGDVVLEPVRRNVLVIGTPTQRVEAVETNLLAFGLRPEQVTVLDAAPDVLAPYGEVWHVGGALGAAERARLETFVRDGGGLLLTGGSGVVNDSLETLVNALVPGGGIEVGVTGTSTNGLHQFLPGAAGGVTRIPNLLDDLDRSGLTRFLTGLAPRNELMVMATSPDVPGAVWDARDLVGQQGRLLLITGGSWIVAGESLAPFENFHAFLRHQPKARGSR